MIHRVVSVGLTIRTIVGRRFEARFGPGKSFLDAGRVIVTVEAIETMIELVAGKPQPVVSMIFIGPGDDGGGLDTAESKNRRPDPWF